MQVMITSHCAISETAMSASSLSSGPCMTCCRGPSLKIAARVSQLMAEVS